MKYELEAALYHLHTALKHPKDGTDVSILKLLEAVYYIVQVILDDVQ